MITGKSWLVIASRGVAEAGQAVDVLGDHRATEQRTDVDPELRHDWRAHRHVAQWRKVIRDSESPFARRADVVLPEDVEHRGTGEAGVGGRRDQGERQPGKHQAAEPFEQALGGRGVTRAGEPTKPVDRELIVEHLDHEQPEHERRHRVEDEGGERRPTVEQRAGGRTAEATPLSTPIVNQMMAAPAAGKSKQPYCFEVNEGKLFAFAGLWDRWKDPSGLWIKSCSILTTTPNAVISAVHDRMPVILDPEAYDLWLDPGMANVEAVSEMLKPYDARTMRCYPVSTRVNHVANDDPECSARVELTATQTGLFSC